MDEIEDRFGKSTPRRRDLFIRLRLFVELARHCGPARILVDGSFVSSKPEPGDVDVVIWLGVKYFELLKHDDGEAILLEEMFDKGEPGEAFLVETESQWNGWVDFFSQNRKRFKKRKGLVEINLT